MYFPYIPLQLEIMGSPQEGCGMVVDVEKADLAVVLLENHDEGVNKLQSLHRVQQLDLST